MKTTRFYTLLQTSLAIIFSILMVTSVLSCATKANFATSSVVPAARGYVKVKKDNNNNYIIKIEISNLAEIERLMPAKKTYVVWMVSNQDVTKNLGQLKSSSGFLSKKLNASFEAVTSDKPSKIFITAEDEANAYYPATQVVLSTNRF